MLRSASVEPSHRGTAECGSYERANGRGGVRARRPTAHAVPGLTLLGNLRQAPRRIERRRWSAITRRSRTACTTGGLQLRRGPLQGLGARPAAQSGLPEQTRRFRSSAVKSGFDCVPQANRHYAARPQEALELLLAPPPGSPRALAGRAAWTVKPGVSASL